MKITDIQTIPLSAPLSTPIGRSQNYSYSAKGALLSIDQDTTVDEVAWKEIAEAGAEDLRRCAENCAKGPLTRTCVVILRSDVGGSIPQKWPR